MRMGPSQIRLFILTVLLVSIIANLCLLFRTQGDGTVVVSFRDEEEKIRWEAKQMVLRLVDKYDLSSRETAKALVFDSLMTCVFDKFQIDSSKKTSGNFSLLDQLETVTLQKWTKKLESDIAVKNSVIDFLSQPIVNNFSFTYVNNPKNVCSTDVPEVLLVVPSAPENFENRVKVRRSGRGMYTMNVNNRARLLFFVGKPANNNRTLQSKVNDEAYVYGDIVQMDFVDVYRNILLKAVSMLKWAATYCPKATYVIRTDDDVKVDVQQLLKVLKRKSEQYENFILGDKKVSWEVVRSNTSKYFVSQQEYLPSTLPPFALGGLLGYPSSTVSLLYQAALRLKPLWLDDVFITGMCAPKVGVLLLDDPDFVFTHHDW
ncbi:beta-1,3-galactosyltransferase 1-like [Biomphalaria glabrata]|uniref:Hexosyltransferase n=1 Tax=Biomphalaria glabrata TaxID=6526 RepID=A0A9U8DXB9_BIOGL|nr:beta-1,3-galactosyltransferase 1-like [Biomphalaria glabrata]XP_013064275.2 beta-1,3-galactosyltransferase 1-like [Biomphalaria glabrata]XP_055873130.1 beta-1,3-galactosyltransferase 1-like [Biomphalaria glabrata]KAI8752505.1 beta-1; 3-galactosyltransferase 1-like [Biomphalaria glabrata]